VSRTRRFLLIHGQILLKWLTEETKYRQELLGHLETRSHGTPTASAGRFVTIRQIAQLIDNLNFIQTSHRIALKLSSFASFMTVPLDGCLIRCIPASVIKNCARSGPAEQI
jgi:hypothetical protein